MPYSFFTDSVQSIPLYLPSLHAAPPFSPEPAFNPPLYLPSLHAALSLNFISGVHFPLPCPLPLSFLHAGSFLFSTNQRSIYLSICHLCTPLFPLTPFPAFIFLCLVLCHSLFCTPGPAFSLRTSVQLPLYLPSLHAALFLNSISGVHFSLPCPLPLSFLHAGPFLFSTNQRSITSLPPISARRSFPLTPFPAFIFLCFVPCHSLFCTPGPSFSPQTSVQLPLYLPFLHATLFP